MTMPESLKADLQHTGNNSISKIKANLSANEKVKVTLELFEGNDRPNVAFILTDANGNVIARSFIISSIEQQMDFTLHIRQAQPVFPLTIICETFFEENLPVDRKEIIIQQ
jgi:hypothetical protein